MDAPDTAPTHLSDADSAASLPPDAPVADEQQPTTAQDIRNAQWLSLSRDEEILWWGHPSYIPHMLPMGLSLLSSLFGLGVFIFFDFGFLPLLFVPIGIMGAAIDYVKIITTFYVVTSDKIVRKVGIIQRDTISVRYENIEHSRDNQSIIERILGFGDIEVATAGTALVELEFVDVRHPRHVSKLINQQKDDAYAAMRHRNAPPEQR